MDPLPGESDLDYVRRLLAYPSAGLSEEELDLLSSKLEAASRLTNGKDFTESQFAATATLIYRF
jgi:hypothetical protein